MSTYDICNLIGTINVNQIKDDMAETTTKELVDIYKSLTDVIGVCLKCGNIPSVSFVLSQFQYVYALEITNRFLFVHDDDLRDLALPLECLLDYMSLDLV